MADDTRPMSHPAGPGQPCFVAAHFGEFLQGRLGPNGPVVVITLPCKALGVSISASPRGDRVSAEDQVFLNHLGLAPPSEFQLELSVPPGLGAGMSTARLVALARFAGWSGSADDLARACLAVEGATDPLMFPKPETMLWASRRAECISTLPDLPDFEVVGGFFGPPHYTDPADEAYPDVSDLVEAWKTGTDRTQFAALASQSAGRTLAMRGPASDPTEHLAKELGALGWQISHSGAARGLLFAPGMVPEEAEAQMTAGGLRDVFRFQTGVA